MIEGGFEDGRHFGNEETKSGQRGYIIHNDCARNIGMYIDINCEGG